MITSLKLENFVIVDKLELSFDDGLQVLTGETGAGKSIIAGAVNVVLGGKVVPGMLFQKDRKAGIEVTFSLEPDNRELVKLLKDNEVDVSEGELYFRKEIRTDLRSRTFLNGRRIPNRLIEEFRPVLIDFHSQKDQQKLLENEYQLLVLDHYGGLDRKREVFSEYFARLKTGLEELRKMKQLDREREEKIQLYKYQLNELNSAGLKPGEDEKIQKELNLLSNAEEIINLGTAFEQLIYENENSIYDILNDHYVRFSRFQDDNKNLKSSVSFLQDAMANLDDAVKSLQKVRETVDLDRSLKSELEERLDLINGLKAKYRKDLIGLISYRDEIESAIGSFSSDKARIGSMEQELDRLTSELEAEAAELSSERKKAAFEFEKEIMTNIRKLAMPEAEIKIKFDIYKSGQNDNSALKGMTPSGIDRVEIMFTANRGVRLQPLREAASGGELSRFLLTLKKILSGRLDRRTIILDEIDTGIGGKTSQLLGEFIREIGHSHQVLCITHLAQIASFANDHYGIEKVTGTGHAKVKVRKLNEEEQRNEIARMLSGSQSELALKYADEILNKEENVK